MHRPSRRHPLFSLFLLAVACGGTGGGNSCGGCAGSSTEPMHADLPDEFKTYNAIQARLRPEAFDFISSKFRPILKNMFPPNGDVVIQVPESKQGSGPSCVCIGVGWNGGCQLGTWGRDPTKPYTYICPNTTSIDMGNCGTHTFPDYRAQGHCQATVTPKGLTIGRSYPNRLTVTPTLDLYTRTARNANGAIAIAGWVPLLGEYDCFAKLTASNKKPNIPLLMQVDSKTKAMYFEPANFDLDGLITGDDFEIYGCALGDFGQSIQDFLQSTFGFDFYGWIINSVILPLAKSQVDATIAAQVRAQTGMPCDFYKSGCAGAYPGAVCATSGDNRGYCTHNGALLHKPQGMVGTMDLGAMLSALGGGSMPTDVYVAAGQKGTVGQEPFVPNVTPAPLDLRVVGALHPKRSSPCVPARPRPTFTDVPTFNAAAWTPPAPSDPARWPSYPSYMVGLGVAEAFFNRSLYELYSGGALCLNVGSETSSLISAGLFRTFLPSLGTLTEDQDAPMILAIRPQEVPYVRIGQGTYHQDGAQLVLDDPLLSVNMPRMQIAFYALVLDRYVQLFSLQTDIALKLGIEVRADNTLRPILGEIKDLATNIDVVPGELLAEDPSILADLVPTMIAFAEPMLAGAIAPIALPVVQNFRLKVRDLRGVIPKGDGFETLAVFADLEYACPPGQSCAKYAVDTQAEVAWVEVPTKDEIRATLGRGLKKPRVVIDARQISTRAGDGAGQFSWRVDGGLWSPWINADRFIVEHPKLLIQGWHEIEVEARPANDPEAIDPTPAKVRVLVDWEPPEGSIVEDPDAGAFTVEARDLISPADKLTFRWRLGEGTWSAPSREPPMIAFEEAQGEALEVEVKDEAGNKATLRSAGFGDLRGIHGRRTPTGGGGCGCAASASPVGALWLALAAAILLCWRRAIRPL